MLRKPLTPTLEHRYKELKDVIKTSPNDFENAFNASVKNVSEFYEIKTEQLQNDFMTLLRASSSGRRRGNRVPLLEQDSSFDNVSKHDMRNALVDLYVVFEREARED